MDARFSIKMATMCRVLLAFLSCALPLAAQSWDVLSNLKLDDSIKVLDSADHEQKGSFRSVSATAISIATGKGEVAIERARVRRVQVKSSSRRVRNAVIGAAIGLALGLVVDLTLGVYLRNEVGEGAGGRALTYIVPIGLFGGVGAAAGAIGRCTARAKHPRKCSPWCEQLQSRWALRYPLCGQRARVSLPAVDNLQWIGVYLLTYCSVNGLQVITRNALHGGGISDTKLALPHPRGDWPACGISAKPANRRGAEAW